MEKREIRSTSTATDRYVCYPTSTIQKYECTNGHKMKLSNEKISSKEDTQRQITWTS